MGSSNSKSLETPTSSSLIQAKSKTDCKQPQKQDELKQAQQFVVMNEVERELIETMRLLQEMSDLSLQHCSDSLGDASPENIQRLQKLPQLLMQLASPRLQQLLQYVALSNK